MPSKDKLAQLLDDHMATCSECTRDSIDADGYAKLGEYCPVACQIISSFTG